MRRSAVRVRSSAPEARRPGSNFLACFAWEHWRGYVGHSPMRRELGLLSKDARRFFQNHSPAQRHTRASLFGFPVRFACARPQQAPHLANCLLASFPVKARWLPCEDPMPVWFSRHGVEVTVLCSWLWFLISPVGLMAAQGEEAPMAYLRG